MAGYPQQLYSAVLWALLGAASFGYHLGVLNTCIASISKEYGLPEVSLSPWATSALLVGAAAGCMFGGHAADVLGPRRALLLNNVILLLGSLLCAASWHPTWLCIGRIIAGLGCGAASLFVPRYIAEVSPSDVRGTLGTLTQVFINVGILASYLIGIPYQHTQNYSVQLLGEEVDWWRIMMASAMLPALLQILLAPLAPESIVWLQWKGHSSHAAAAATRLHGDTSFLQEHTQQSGLLDAEQANTEGPQDATDTVESWSGLLKHKYKWILGLVLALPIFQQLSGINTVIFFSSAVFSSAGVSNPVAATILVGAVNLGFTFVASALMDKKGRKTLLLTSHSGMAACLIAMLVTAGLANWVPGLQGLVTYVTLIAILLYIAFFALGVGPIPWLVLPELLPAEIKGKAGALATAANWLTNLVVGLSFPYLLALLGVGSYAVYAIFNVIAVAFFSAYMVETQQQSLQAIHAKMLLKDRD